MTTQLSRRTMLKQSSALGALVLGTSLGESAWASRNAAKTPAADKLGWRIATQLYTFRRFTFYEALEMISGLGIKYVEPAFFLPLAKKHPGAKTGPSLATPLRKEMKAEMAARGITMPNFYANLGTDQQANRQVFEFAREMNVETIVSEPPAEAFDGIEKLCNEFKINLAVHNHPKSPKSKYWKPENVLKVCDGRGKRIGACCDTGHWVRSGLDPLDCLKILQGRIITLHLKDVVEVGNPKARDVPLGTGKADYGSLLRELHQQRFKGVLTIEYEHDSDELLDDVSKCLQFVERTAASLVRHDG